MLATSRQRGKDSSSKEPARLPNLIEIHPTAAETFNSKLLQEKSNPSRRCRDSLSCSRAACRLTHPRKYANRGINLTGWQPLYLHGAYHGAQREHGGWVPQGRLAVKRALSVHEQHGDLQNETDQDTDLRCKVSAIDSGQRWQRRGGGGGVCGVLTESLVWDGGDGSEREKSALI